MSLNQQNIISHLKKNTAQSYKSSHYTLIVISKVNDSTIAFNN